MNTSEQQKPVEAVVYIEAGAVETNNDIEAKFPKNQVKGLSISLLVFGAIPVILDIIALCSDSPLWLLSDARSLTIPKLILDLLPICTGMTGLKSTMAPSKGKLRTCYYLARFVSAYTGILLCYSIPGVYLIGSASTADHMYTAKAIAVPLLILNLLNMALSIRCAVCCSRGLGINCCCGGKRSAGTIHGRQQSK